MVAMVALVVAQLGLKQAVLQYRAKEMQVVVGRLGADTMDLEVVAVLEPLGLMEQILLGEMAV
jgi:hypothetical protein